MRSIWLCASMFFVVCMQFSVFAQSLVIFEGNEQVALVNSFFENQLKVTVFEDIDGVQFPLEGATVEFSVTPNDDGAACFFSGNTTVITDSDGRASIFIFANGIPGTYKVTATLIDDGRDDGDDSEDETTGRDGNNDDDEEETVSEFPDIANNPIAIEFTISNAIINITAPNTAEGNDPSNNNKMVFTIEPSLPLTQGYVFDITTRDNTASQSDNDYLPSSMEAVYIGPPNRFDVSARDTDDQSVRFEVEIVGDIIVEDDELLDVVVTEHFGEAFDGFPLDEELNHELSKNLSFVGSGIIVNDDVLSLSVTAREPQGVLEGNGETPGNKLGFSVALSNPVSQFTVVHVEVMDGTATLADSDYLPLKSNKNDVPTVINREMELPTSGVILFFFPGSPLTQTVEVEIVGDTKVEPDETLMVIAKLDNSFRQTEQGFNHAQPITAMAIGTILNDDKVNLKLTKTAQPSVVKKGENVTYTLVVTNNGSVVATGVSVTDILPKALKFDSANVTQGTVGETGGTVIALFGSLEPKASSTLTIITTVIAPGSIRNTATATAKEVDEDVTDNAPSADIAVTQDLDNPYIGADLRILLRFNRSGQDSLVFNTRMELPEMLVLNGTEIQVDVGGIVRTFTLDEKGKDSVTDGKIKFSNKRLTRSGVIQARMSMVLSKANLASSLEDENLRNENVFNPNQELRFVQTQVTIGNALTFGQLLSLNYRARKDVSGLGTRFNK